VRDISSLQERCPDVFCEFKHGAFTAKKTGQPFSAISLDQAHEQINALVKGESGAVCLTENPGALRRWMVAGPEIARLVTEFEEDFDKNGTILDVTPPDHHHEQTKRVQKKFVHVVQSLVTTIEQMGNPFMEDSMDLLNLNSKAVMPCREGCKKPEEHVFAGEGKVLPIHGRAFKVQFEVKWRHHSTQQFGHV